MQPRTKPGTRPKGDRQAITVRVPTPHREVIDEARRKAGYSNLSDYCAALLAEIHGLDVPSYAKPQPEDQDTLLRAG